VIFEIGALGQVTAADAPSHEEGVGDADLYVGTS
jgi:hypothetical protein